MSANSQSKYDMALLASDFAPKDEVVHELLSLVKQQDEEIQNIEFEVSQLPTRLLEMRARQTALQTSRAVTKAFLAPVRRVPPEIIGEIFLYVASDYCSAFHDLSPLPLLKICRRWRRIAQGVPKLWTRLTVMAKSISNICGILENWLLNSGSLPVDLNIYYSILEDDFINPKGEMMQIILRNFHRFRSIEGPIGPSFLAGLPSQDLPIHAPSLRCFRMRGFIDNNDPLEPRLKGCIRSPHLAEIHLYGVTRMIECFTSLPSCLRRLTLHPFIELSPSPLNLIRSCHCLAFLAITLTSTTPPTTTEISSRICLPSLQTLDMKSYENIDLFSPFLDAIAAPSLQKLSLFLPARDIRVAPVFAALRSFIGEDAPLQHLSIQLFGPLDSVGFTCVLSRLTNLRYLTLTHCGIDEAIFRVLTPALSSPLNSWICPRLCAFSHYQTEFHGASLVQLARSRASLAEADHSRFRVDLIGCEGLNSDDQVALETLASNGSFELNVQSGFSKILHYGI